MDAEPMQYVIAWAGFLGVWLLVAGPIFQAALELQEEEVDREALAGLKDQVPEPEAISPWWWLLPPVALIRQRRISERYRRQVMELVPDEMAIQFVHFIDKATGWMLVAAGAFLIAVKETWELHELQHWPFWLFWVLLVVMVAVALGYTVVRMRRTARAIAERREAVA